MLVFSHFHSVLQSKSRRRQMIRAFSLFFWKLVMVRLLNASWSRLFATLANEFVKIYSLPLNEMSRKRQGPTREFIIRTIQFLLSGQVSILKKRANLPVTPRCKSVSQKNRWKVVWNLLYTSGTITPNARGVIRVINFRGENGVAVKPRPIFIRSFARRISSGIYRGWYRVDGRA